MMGAGHGNDGCMGRQPIPAQAVALLFAVETEQWQVVQFINFRQNGVLVGWIGTT